MTLFNRAQPRPHVRGIFSVNIDSVKMRKYDQSFDGAFADRVFRPAYNSTRNSCKHAQVYNVTLLQHSTYNLKQCYYFDRE